MEIHLIEITDPGLAYMVIGGFVVAFSMVSLLVKQKLYINEVVLGTACGVIFGPYCANVFNPRSWGGDINLITLEVMRITLAVGLFAIGVELPPSYLLKHAKGLLVMVVPTMAFGWLIVAAVIFVVFPPLDFVSSMVIAACLTPTDPIISAAIVGGKFAEEHVPENLRHIISAESAANDGLAYPFLSISIYLTIETSRRVAFEKWALIGWLYQVVLGTVIGSLLGLGFSHLMKLSRRVGFIDRESYVAQYLALALFTIGVTRTLGSDDLLAAFAAGCAINWDGEFNMEVENEVFSSVIDLMLNCGCFIYIGAWMPFKMFNASELGITPWRLVILFTAVVFLRRIPPLLLIYRWVPEITTWREAIFSGHFGPMGVGAIFVSTLAVTELPTPQSPPQNQAEFLAATLQTIVAFVVLGSIIIHGLSIPFFSFGRDMGSRTLSLTRTLTSRHTGPPDWLFYIRRGSTDITRPGTLHTTERDVEQGIEQIVVLPAEAPGELAVTPSQDSEASKKGPYIPETGSSRYDVTYTKSETDSEEPEMDVNLDADMASNVNDSTNADVQPLASARMHAQRPAATTCAPSIRSAPASDSDDLAEPRASLGAQTPILSHPVRVPVGVRPTTNLSSGRVASGIKTQAARLPASAASPPIQAPIPASVPAEDGRGGTEAVPAVSPGAAQGKTVILAQ